MTATATHFPMLPDRLFLTYTGMETDLLFTRGVELPGFASYPLLESEQGRALLRGYMRDLIGLGRAHGVGVILESPTWVANRDRGAQIGYAPDLLLVLNQSAIALMAEARAEAADVPVVLSANIGPRDDAYAPSEQMDVAQAEAYHSEQIAALAGTAVDVISGYTIAYPAEAAGIVLAARRVGLPCVIAFTLETDGRLPTGATLADAIAKVDEATDGYAAYFMINCAHPDHFADTLDVSLEDAPWMGRVRGIVANASRCSHGELDQAETLDDGNPEELAAQLADLRARFGHLTVLGGCCGTDMRHLGALARAVAPQQG